MSNFKHITSYRNWLKVNENSDQEEEVMNRIEDLNRAFEQAASGGSLQTSDLMVWFHGMLELYDGYSLKGLIFNKMKSVFAKYFKVIYPVLSMQNRELTQRDITEIKRYKGLTGKESSQQKQTSDFLSDLGLD
jgi:hypothetical protein